MQNVPFALSDGRPLAVGTVYDRTEEEVENCSAME